MRTYHILTLLLFALLLAGCQTTGSSEVATAPAGPVGQPLAQEAVGTAYRVALATQIGDMRHQDPVEQVEYDDGALRATRESGFAYEGFKLSELVVLSAEEAGRDDQVHAVAKFADDSGRGTAVQSLLRYREQDGKLVIAESQAVPVYSPVPRVEFYVVGYDAWAAAFGERKTDWRSMYAFAKANEVGAKAPGAVEDKYLILVFAMDRIDPDTLFELAVSTSRSGTPENSMVDAKYADYDGWRVALVPGEFSMGRGARFHVNAFLTPTMNGVPQLDKRRLVERFTKR